MSLSKMSLDNLEIVDFEGAKRPNASKVWTYFFKENGVFNKSQTVCKLCHAVKAYKGGNTSNMKAHLNAFHCDIVNSWSRITEEVGYNNCQYSFWQT